MGFLSWLLSALYSMSSHLVVCTFSSCTHESTMELLPKEGHVIVIFEHLKTNDMHTKSGVRSDLNINVKIYRGFLQYIEKAKNLWYYCTATAIKFKFHEVFHILLNSILKEKISNLLVSPNPVLVESHVHINQLKS